MSEKTLQAFCVKCRVKVDMKNAEAMTLKNGRPARKWAVGTSSPGSRVRRWSPIRRVFSEVRVVAATRSARSLQRRMQIGRAHV